MFTPFRRIVQGAVAALVVTGCGEEPPADPETVWNAARPYALAEVERRQDDWAHADSAARMLPPEAVERSRAAVAAIPGGLRLLVVSEDGCIDSAHSVPYLAALAAEVPGLELRLADSSVGRGLLAAHPSPDGREATPTALLLDAEGELRGCWVERPAALQSWYLANPDDLERTDLYVAKTHWYEADGGAHLLAEMARILEAAAAGSPLCGLPLEPAPRLPPPGEVPES